MQLLNKRILSVLFLSFSSTLPLVLLSGTLQAWYTDVGVNLVLIGSLSLLQYPYLIKFLWAPLIDRYAPPWLGRRAWILWAQIAIAIALVVIAFMNPAKQPWAVFCVSAVIAFFSASQDISIDGYRVDVLQRKERGLGAAVTNIGGRLAMLVGGGLALILASAYGWRTTYLVMAVLMFAQIIATLWAPNPRTDAKMASTVQQAIIAPFKELLTRRHIALILLFIVIYKLGDALALSLHTSFLMRKVGFTLLELGYTYKLVSIIATLLGGIAGGLLIPRLTLYRSLIFFGLSQALANLSFIVLALVGKNFFFLVTSVFLDYFCGGLSTIAFVAFLIGLCRQEYSATQYAILSALTAVGRVVIGPLAAFLVKNIGWSYFYLVTFFVGLPSLFILRWLHSRVDLEDSDFSRSNKAAELLIPTLYKPNCSQASPNP